MDAKFSSQVQILCIYCAYFYINLLFPAIKLRKVRDFPVTNWLIGYGSFSLLNRRRKETAAEGFDPI